MCVGFPRGPRRWGDGAPSSSALKAFVVPPTAWKMMVIVPASASASAMVSGIRSP
jgi:hypothetical protein